MYTVQAYYFNWLIMQKVDLTYSISTEELATLANLLTSFRIERVLSYSHTD